MSTEGNQMKEKKVLILSGLLLFFGSLNLIGNIIPIRAVATDQTISTIAEKDTYVNSYEGLSNYGGQDYALSGFYFTGDILEAYFYFNFTDKPADFTKAEISLDFWGVSETMNFTVSLINDDWGELSMNWINKPVTKGDLITHLVVTGSGINKIDITNLISSHTNISICVYLEVDNYVDDYVYITSREGYYSWAPEDAPQLIWTYPEDTDITITSPISSSNWQEINTYTITWTSVGTITDVIIQLYKGDTFVEDITYTYTNNDGNYNFYVSSSENYDGTDYQIKIIDYDNSNVFVYSDYFSINVHSGTITVTSPTSSTSWKPGSLYSITWTSTGTISDVDIDFYKGTTQKYYLDEYSNAGTYYWTLPTDIVQGTDWRILISNSDNSAQYDWSDYFKISEGGTITITNPTSSSTWRPSSTYDITWTSTGLIDSVEIDIYKENVLTYFYSAETDDGSFTWEIPTDIEQGSDWQIKISNSDYSDQNDWSGEFQIAKKEDAIHGYNISIILSIPFIISVIMIRRRMKSIAN